MSLKTRRRSHLGFTLAETTIILATLSVLGAVVSPSINDYVNDARRIKAQSDVRVVAATLARFLYDVGGDIRPRSGNSPVALLVGAGDTPGLGAQAEAEWALPVDGKRVVLLDDYLVTNAAGYRQGSREWFGGRGWSGPYVESGVGPDPWGHRYAVNVRALSGPAGSSAIMLCAGPNGVVETSFSGSGLVLGDDAIGQIGAGGR